MQLEGVGTTRPHRVASQIWLKFGRPACNLVAEISRGGESYEVAKKLRELREHIAPTAHK